MSDSVCVVSEPVLAHDVKLIVHSMKVVVVQFGDVTPYCWIGGNPLSNGGLCRGPLGPINEQNSVL